MREIKIKFSHFLKMSLCACFCSFIFLLGFTKSKLYCVFSWVLWRQSQLGARGARRTPLT